MRNFFEHKAAAERRTRWLLFGIVLAVIAMGSAVFALAWLMRESLYVRMPLAFRSAASVAIWPLYGWCVGGTATVVGLASLWRIMTLREGGAAVANMLGGRLVNGRPKDQLDRRLLNVVAEMAIAAGTPVPQVYVLDYEPGINALAAGWRLSDAIIAVTRGSLEKLTRAELQGVIAHEFSHLLHGDARLNLRLMGTVFGMLSVALLGKQLLRAGNAGRKSGAVAALAGGLIAAVGYVGAFFGNLIKAAVSRQREYLADAAAVQFTRNPEGIASALKKIGGHGFGARLISAHAEEASHFFFGPISDDFLSLDWFATHPPLEARIRLLDPSWNGRFMITAEGLAEPIAAHASMRAFTSRAPLAANDVVLGLAAVAGAPPVRAMAAVGAEVASPSSSKPPLRAADVVSHVGTAGGAETGALASARTWLAERDPQLMAACESSFSACALVFALLLADEAELRARQLQAVAGSAGPALLKETERLSHLVIYCDRADRLALCALAAPALRDLSRGHAATLHQTAAALIAADGGRSLFENLLGYLLGLHHRPGERSIVRRRLRLRATASEAQLVLSALAHAGASFQDSAASAFRAARERLPDASLTLLAASPRLLSGLAPALDSLRALRPRDAARFVDACAHAVLADRRVTDEEVTMLRAVCVALDAPLPRLS